MGDGQAWWPCDVDGLCQCGSSDGSTTSTATLPLVESCKHCGECVAISGNPHNANDDHCAPCALDGQAWWPCDVDGLCQCGSSDGSTTSTATLPLVESCRTCSECVAIPVNPHNANDEDCAPCALDGQAWWPCDVD